MGQLKIRYFIATGAYCAFIFYLSSLSKAPDVSFTFPGMDKAAHATLYAGLAALLSVGIRRSNPEVRPLMQFSAPVAFAVFYGLTDEIHQRFVPSRTFEMLDLLADGTGAVLAQIFLCAVLWRIFQTGKNGSA